MARRRRWDIRPSTEPTRTQRGKPKLTPLECFACILLYDTQDDDERLTALLIAKIARRRRKEDAARYRSGRYGRRGRYNAVQSEDIFELLIYHFSERWFKQWLRVDRTSFWYLHDLIKDDEVFQSTGKKPQRPVKVQLATFLCMVGAESAVKTATIMSIAEGSVFLYADRVVTAFRNIRDDHLSWPTLEERDEMYGPMESIFWFPGCLGAGDGSYFRLRDKPLRNPYVYWCRKKFYALVIQAVVDYRARFISYELGWPGSVQDSRVFTQSTLWIKRQDFFRDHEYIVVDKGYPLTRFSIRPFNDYDLTKNPEKAGDRKRWNQKLSALRIFVEHAFGRLKGRFPWLRCIPGRDLRNIFETIEALLVIHNILEDLGDDPSQIAGFEPRNDRNGPMDLREANEEGDGSVNTALHGQGVLRRKLLVDYFLVKERNID